MIIYCVFCSLNLNMNFFSQFVFNPASLAATGEPVYPLGGQHVPGGVDVRRHVSSVEDVRVPGFCRTQGTHLFFSRRICEVCFVFYLMRRYTLQNLNHFCMICSSPTFCR